MSCISCQRTKPIPTCTENLTIGTITPDTEVIIYFENLATGRIDSVSATSDAEGLLVADLSELSFSANQAYKITIFDITATSTETPLELTIGAETYECLKIRFKRVHDTTGGLKAYTDITLEIDA